jgi:dUTP pyrophosphatase
MNKQVDFNIDRLTKMVTDKYGDSLIVPEGEDFDEEFESQITQITKDIEGMLSESPSEKLVLTFINESSNQDPTYIYEGDSGFDLRANLNEDLTLLPLERFMVPTGLKFGIPNGYEIQVRPRSGLAAKQGLCVLNTPGTVDQGYTGEVKVILVNLSNDETTISHGDRIAQAVVCPVLTKKTLTLTKTTNLSMTDRGSGGFGSTGVNS